jgi:hypothetical protein
MNEQLRYFYLFQYQAIYKDNTFAWGRSIQAIGSVGYNNQPILIGNVITQQAFETAERLIHEEHEHKDDIDRVLILSASYLGQMTLDVFKNSTCALP